MPWLEAKLRGFGRPPAGESEAGAARVRVVEAPVG
jgi:hypothetical protein